MNSALNDDWLKMSSQIVEKNMQSFVDGKINIFNVCSNTKEIKIFLYQLVNAIMTDLKTRKDFVSLMVETLSVTDIMNIKMMQLEKRIKELEEKSV